MATPGPPPYVVDGVVVIALAPPGYQVNFANPTQQFALEHYLIFGIMGTLATVALGQRLYTKIVLSTGFGIDDGFMIGAWVMSMTTQAILTHSLSIKAMGVHIFEQPMMRFVYAMTLSYAAGGLFMLCNGFAKLSLLTFYLKLSPEPWFRISVWASIVAVGLLTTIITTLLFVHCTPVRASWDVLTQGKCVDTGILYMATAVSNIVTDILIFVLPIPMVLGLQMGVRQKIGALVIFAIGSVTITTSGIRLSVLPALLNAKDVPWDAAPANIWSFVEANLFIICGSMPTLRKFFKHFAPRLVGSYGYGTNAYSGNSKAYGHNTHQKSHHQSRSNPEQGRYNRFGGTIDHEDHEMGRMEASLGMDKDAKTTVVSTRERQGRDGDDGSEKAILTTRTVVVAYD